MLWRSNSAPPISITRFSSVAASTNPALAGVSTRSQPVPTQYETPPQVPALRAPDRSLVHACTEPVASPPARHDGSVRCGFDVGGAPHAWIARLHLAVRAQRRRVRNESADRTAGVIRIGQGALCRPGHPGRGVTGLRHVRTRETRDARRGVRVRGQRRRGRLARRSDDPRCGPGVFLRLLGTGCAGH